MLLFLKFRLDPVFNVGKGSGHVSILFHKNLTVDGMINSDFSVSEVIIERIITAVVGCAVAAQPSLAQRC